MIVIAFQSSPMRSLPPVAAGMLSREERRQAHGEHLTARRFLHRKDE
jgi:hypothetical protein